MPALRATTRLVLTLFVSVGLGCATPVGVRHVDERSVNRTLTANVLSVGEPSVASRHVLLRLGLFEGFASDPVGTLAALHAHAIAEMDSDQLFALAEYSFLYASRERDRGYFIAASIYAYAYLFPDDGSPPPDPFDPRLRTAVDLYNRSIAAALVEDDGDVALPEGSFPFPLGTLELRIDRRGFEWAGHRLTNFVPAAELEVRGLRNRYRRAGIGAPFVAEPAADPERPIEVENARVARGVRVPVTFFVRYGNARAALRSGVFPATLEVYSEHAAREIEVAGRAVPLEYETSSALAYSLEGSTLWDFEIAGYLRGEVIPTASSLFMLRPYVRGRIPVVLVHGTASSPARWAELLNELESDPKIEAHYQFWMFIYSTGNPILYSASVLRESLRAAVVELDPEGDDPALRRMVVIGHSQGGLLTRLQVVASGDRFWAGLSDRPFDDVALEPDTRELLRNALFFEPVPTIESVIFISTPHRGSFIAGNWLGRIASSLVQAPGRLVETSLDLARGGVDAVRGTEDATFRRKMAQIPTSVDNMTPGNRFIVTLSSLPIADGVIAHSIIPVTGDAPPEGQNDGVVEYESAHIDGVESELVVYRCGHSVQSNPEAIQEVRRILLENVLRAE